MRTCVIAYAIVSHILQKPTYHIFFAYNGIFKIAYAQVMPHMRKFTYMSKILHISAQIFAFPHIFLHKETLEEHVNTHRKHTMLMQKWKKNLGKAVPLVSVLYLSIHYWQCFQ